MRETAKGKCHPSVTDSTDYRPLSCSASVIDKRHASRLYFLLDMVANIHKCSPKNTGASTYPCDKAISDTVIQASSDTALTLVITLVRKECLQCDKRLL
jgi:hypothetical protein